jgi:hypothetical protein
MCDRRQERNTTTQKRLKYSVVPNHRSSQYGFTFHSYNIKFRSSERTNSAHSLPLAVPYTVVIILPLPLNSCYWCRHLSDTQCGYNRGRRWQSRTQNIHGNSFSDVCSLFNEATLASLKISLEITLPIALWRHTQLSNCQLKCDLFLSNNKNTVSIFNVSSLSWQISWTMALLCYYHHCHHYECHCTYYCHCNYSFPSLLLLLSSCSRIHL